MPNLLKLNENVVELILEGIDSSEEVFSEEMASIVKNNMVTWAKFILTDDKPNKNKRIIPQEQFDNIIKSGIHMPIKMAYEEIGEYHDDAIPIGVITNLKKVKNQVVGLAAFWNKERPEDVAMLKERYASDKPINVSWEILAKENENEDGNIELEDVSLRAATIVGLPAYGGRTPVLQMASKFKLQEDKILDELEKIKKELQDAKEANAKLAEELKEAKASTMTFDELSKEAQELRKFKEEVDAEKEREEKLASLKEKFVESGINKDEEYFVENGDRLLKLDDESIAFMLQEMVAFAEKSEEKASEEKKAKAPNFKTGDGDDDESYSELAESLRQAKMKKE